MIKKLKRRFIILAMVSLAVLLAVIVAGMNIVNYQKVVSDADARIEVLEQNANDIFGRMNGPFIPRGGEEVTMYAFGAEGDSDDHGGPGAEDFGGSFGGGNGKDPFFGRDGKDGPSMSMDEAEESRFFTVSVDESGNTKNVNVDRISSVDENEASEYAQKALAEGRSKGFIGEMRYSAGDYDTDTGLSTIVFLDCGRVLESFRDFLKYSIIMSVLGLLLMFAVITYFAGRIVRPVAESYEKQKRFITDAGHEIKTPLAIIKANIDVLNMDIENGIEGSLDGRDARTENVISEKAAAELRDSLGDINDQVERLTGLTNDLVYLSRMEEGGNSMVMIKLSLSDMAEKMSDSFRPLAEETGKEINSEIEPDVFVNGSSKELEKLLSILLENAVKYSLEPRVIELGPDECGMPAPPVISVKLRKDGRNAVVEVRNDTESELSNEALSHVFERFYRTDSSRNSETGGHGIGLSMAQAIVNAHGGKIFACTSTGRDFVITASIPLV